MKQKIKVLFICHGNICRSPMAEFVMKDMAAKAGQAERFEIASAATSTEEIGNPVYPPARRKLAEHGIGCAGKTARQMTRRDYEYYDHLIAMDRSNLRNMQRFVGSDPAGTSTSPPATTPRNITATRSIGPTAPSCRLSTPPPSPGSWSTSTFSPACAGWPMTTRRPRA